jgi:hypothetical protein
VCAKAYVCASMCVRDGKQPTRRGPAAGANAKRALARWPRCSVLLLGAFCRCAKAIAQVLLLWWLLLLWVAAARTGTCASEDTTL